MTRAALEKSDYDWQELAQSNEASAREGVFESDFAQEARRFVAEAHRNIEQELCVVTADAKKSADAFWNINEAMREEGGKENQGYFGTRVRIWNNALEATWYINRFVEDGRTRGKKKVLSTYLKKGEGTRYPKGAFKTAKDWEREAIEMVEDRYELLRKRSAVLSKLRRNLAEYARLLEKSYEVDSQNRAGKETEKGEA